MTIGIGVLYSSKPRPHVIRPDGLVLLADTMGSTDTDSTSELHKLYVEENLYVACAGKVEMASEVISLFKQELAQKTPEASRTTGDIWDALNRAVHAHRMMHFRWDVIAPNYMFTEGTMFESDHPKVIKDWQEYDPGIQLLVGTFHPSGVALLYYIGQFEGTPGWVFNCQFPGYCTIGTGAYNANMWLNFRHQQFGLNAKQSIYHAYEAKVMANMTPTVNTNLEAVIAFADRHYLLTDEKPTVDGCPISLSELRSMFREHGPQDTNKLGHQKIKILSGNKGK